MSENAARTKPTTYDQLYPGRFIKAGELLGKKHTLTISDVDVEELEGDKKTEMKCVISFRETKKKLVTCKTNGICLREMFGRELAGWIGKRVIIFPDTWNGEPCIRVWGSPDLEREMEIEVKLPRRAPIRKTMRTSAGNGAKAKAPARTQDAEPDEPPPGALADDREPGIDG